MGAVVNYPEPTKVTVEDSGETIVLSLAATQGPQGPQGEQGIQGVPGDLSPAGQAAAAAAIAAAVAADASESAAQASESSATASASTATTQAGIATTQAGTATTQATTATTQAGVATTQAGIATTQAGVATTQAGNSATSATASQTSRLASETAQGAAESAQSSATSSASTATTQAGIATTQAGIATTQAGNASDSATASQTSRLASESARDSATASQSSATTSADTATTQAGVATTQAGISTTQAGIATTQATNSAASASAALVSEVASALSASDSLAAFEGRIRGASVLNTQLPRTPDGEQLLKQSVLWLDALHSSAGAQTITNLGWGGSALNAQTGSTGGADSNDPRFLNWTGQSYVYLPGVAGNYLSVPDEAALDITGDIDIRVQVAMDDWTPGGTNVILSKFVNTLDQRSYQITLRSTGVLRLHWSSNGTNAGVITADSTVAPTVSDGLPLWIRATLDVDNGASGYDVKFFTSSDGVTYTQLGTTVTGGATTSIFASTAALTFGQDVPGVTTATGKFYRAQVFNGINGTPVLNVDTSVITSGAATSFTALTGQTVTISRSTAGRKAVAVVSPCWLFGTDDYMEVADNDLIDFGAADSFTVLAVVRQWATPTSNGAFISKWPGAGQAGYALFNSTTTVNGAIYVNDASTAVTRVGTGGAFNSLTTYVGVINRAAQQSVLYTNAGASATSSISAIGSVSNALPLRVGRNTSAANYQDFELVAVAVFRRALTAGEITTLNSYYQARIGG